MEDPVYLEDEQVLCRMLASERRQEMQSYFESRLQRDFNENDRRELANWMRDVCGAEDCQPDIFPLSIMIVDRFLSFVRTKRTQLQLLGAVALLLASKLRQTHQIPAKHLVYYTQDLITMNELKTWELFVLTTLRWDLALITPVDYLDILMRRIQTIDIQTLSDIEEDAQRLIYQWCTEEITHLSLPSMIAWVCLQQAMELRHLTSDAMRFADMKPMMAFEAHQTMFPAGEMQQKYSLLDSMDSSTCSLLLTTTTTTTTTSSSSSSSSSSPLSSGSLVSSLPDSPVMNLEHPGDLFAMSTIQQAVVRRPMSLAAPTGAFCP